MAATRHDSDEVQRVQRDVIVRIRRVLESYNLNPLQLGLPPRPGDWAADAIVGLGRSESSRSRASAMRVTMRYSLGWRHAGRAAH